MEEDKIIGKLHFSFTNEFETTTLDKTYNDVDSEEFETIYWFVEEFKYFLKAIGFSESMTDRIVYLEAGEKVVDEYMEKLQSNQNAV